MSNLLSVFGLHCEFFWGYFFSVLLSNLFISLCTSEIHELAKTKRPDYIWWIPACVGGAERLLYTVAWINGQEKFIAVWLAFKGIANWKGWDQGGGGRHLFNIFLLGNALSIAFGVVGGMLILQPVTWPPNLSTLPGSATSAIGLSLGCLGLWLALKVSRYASSIWAFLKGLVSPIFHQA
jgi:hypothetical protein